MRCFVELSVDGGHRYAGTFLVRQPIAFTFNLHHLSMEQQPVEHGCGESYVAGKAVVPLTERQVRGQDDGAVLVALGNEL